MLSKVLADFFLEGLRKGEYCIWIPREGITQAKAVKMIKKHIPNIEDFLIKKQMQIETFESWYLTAEGKFDVDNMMKKWRGVYNNVIKKGFTTMRVVGDGSSVVGEYWDEMMHYEELVNSMISNIGVVAVCTYKGSSYKTDEVQAILKRHFTSLAPH
jgi:hypothetical protein